MKYWKIRLLNCTNKEEPNETILLSEFFKMMQLKYPAKIQFRETQIYTKKQFLDSLTDGWSNLIHISAHGDRSAKNTEIHVGDENEPITATDINELDIKLSLRCVFVSACLTLYKDMADAFCSLETQNYIAPKTDVDWIDAVLFSMTFYKRYIWDNVKFDNAFEYAKKHTRLGKDFPYYWVP